MKHFTWFLCLLFCLFFTQPTFYAAAIPSSGEYSGEPSVYESLENGATTPTPPSTEEAESYSPSVFPLFLKFILSFALVIGLLFLLLRYLSKRNKQMQSSGPILSLGGRVLGNNRSVQVILIGQTIYIVGVGEDINLIRAIPQGEEYQHLLESFENQGETTTPIWFKKDSPRWDNVFRKHMQSMKHEMEEEKLR